MKILVCIEQVPGTSNVEVDPVTWVWVIKLSINKVFVYDY